MINPAVTIFVRSALLPALVLNPYIAVRLLCVKADMAGTLALACGAAVALNALMPVGLHYLNVPVSAFCLAAAHWGLCLVLLAAARARRLGFPALRFEHDRALIPLAAAFAILVLPFTRLAGIDTYKWQDLATNVRLEQCIPWLVHPLSLLGFTPRAYPCAQPLALATIQILGGLGVDWGYFIMSVLSGATGILSAYVFARRFFHNPGHGAWFAFCYVFSPVFLRYNHWATGRGLFVSLFPLFLLTLLDARGARNIIAVFAAALLLALSHKTGLVAALLVIGSLALVPCLPRSGSGITTVLLVLSAVAAATLLAPAVFLPRPFGSALGLIRYDIARFGWLVPAAAIGLTHPRLKLSEPDWRRLFPAALLSFPIAHAGEMYGALMALAFVALAATAGLIRLIETFPARTRLIAGIAIALTLAGALITVGQRWRAATPGAVREAARFLEAHDPVGPYRVHAPGRAQSQVQAYVSGCPRFRIAASAGARVAIAPLPPLSGNPKDLFRKWSDYLRNPFSFPGLNIDWYDRPQRDYYIVIAGEGMPPPGAKLLFGKDGMEVYEYSE